MMDYTLIFAAPNNATTFIQKLAYINSLTDVGYGGMIGIFILLVIGCSLFFIMKSFKAETAFGVSMLITSVIGVLLRFMNLVNDYVVYVCIIAFIVSLYFLKKEAANYEV